MFTPSVKRIASHRRQSPKRGLLLPTLCTVAVILACRFLVCYISHDPAELDGFIFLAGLYWSYSVVGYIATRPKGRRQSSRIFPHRAVARMSAARISVRNA